MSGPKNHIEVTLSDWERSDAYHNSYLIPRDEILEAVVKNNSAQGLPDIAVSHAQGKYLSLLVKSLGVKRILEVGTLGAYSTIWMARGLPSDGKIITLELSEHHTKVARENIKSAGFADIIEVIQGPATETLAKISAKPPFDFAFIDADKSSNPTYFAHAKRLVRPGGVIIVDNVVRYGRVADPKLSDENIDGIRKLLQDIKEDPEVDATTIATVGDKGYDGFVYAIRK